MEHFIEVTGSSELTEEVSDHRADLNITVRAAELETALTEATNLRQHCIAALLASGLSDSELREGGSETWRPWYWKKKVGQEASHKILISCRDIQRLHKGLAALEPLFNHQRYSLSVSMRKPTFSASDENRNQARRSAIRHASEKAAVLAEEARIVLQHVIQIEELGSTSTGTGMYGDEDWRSVMMAGSAAASLNEDDAEISLDNPMRTSTVRFRVRFACSPPA